MYHNHCSGFVVFYPTTPLTISVLFLAGVSSNTAEGLYLWHIFALWFFLLYALFLLASLSPLSPEGPQHPEVQYRILLLLKWNEVRTWIYTVEAEIQFQLRELTVLSPIAEGYVTVPFPLEILCPDEVSL